MNLHPRYSALRSYDGDAAGPRLRRHLARCATCRARLAAIRGTRAGLAELTRVTPPDSLRDRIERSLAEGRKVIVPTGDLPPRSARAPLRAAVLVLLGVAGGISATVIGAPMIERLLVPDRSAPAAAPRATGVAVPAVDGMRVRLIESAPALRIRVEVTDSDLLEIEARGEASDAVFRPSGGMVTVIGAGPGELWVGVPRGMDRFGLELDGREVLTGDGATLQVRGVAAEGGTEVRLRVPEPSEEATP